MVLYNGVNEQRPFGIARREEAMIRLGWRPALTSLRSTRRLTRFFLSPEESLCDLWRASRTTRRRRNNQCSFVTHLHSISSSQESRPCPAAKQAHT